MYDHARRFVDNNHMIILEDDLELDFLGGGLNLDRFFESDFIYLAFNRGRLTVGHNPAVAGDSPFGDKSAEPGSAEMCRLWHIARERLIKAGRRSSANFNADDA